MATCMALFLACDLDRAYRYTAYACPFSLQRLSTSAHAQLLDTTQGKAETAELLPACEGSSIATSITFKIFLNTELLLRICDLM